MYGIYYIQFVLLYVQVLKGTVMNVQYKYSFYKIYFNHTFFVPLFGCLANRNAELCVIFLKIENIVTYEVEDIKPTYKGGVTIPNHIPQYRCSFNGDYNFDIAETFKCARFSLDILTEIKEECASYDFIIQWTNASEYFIDDSIVNCSINQTMFAYKNITLYWTTAKEIILETIRQTLFSTPKDSTTKNNISVPLYTSNSSTVANNVTTSESNLTPIISVIIACFILLAMVLIYYTVLRYRKKTNNTEVNLKMTPFPGLAYQERREEIISTDCGINSANRTSVRVTSDNYNTIDKINETFHFANFRPAIGDCSTIDEIDDSSNSSGSRCLSDTKNGKNEGDNIVNVKPTKENYSTVNEFDENEIYGSDRPSSVSCSGVDVVNKNSNSKRVTSKNTNSESDIRLPCSYFTLEKNNESNMRVTDIKPENFLSSVNKKHESTYQLNKNCLEPLKINIGCAKSTIASEHEYSRLNENSKVFINEYGELQDIHLNCGANAIPPEHEYTKLNEKKKKVSTNQYGDLKDKPFNCSE